MKTLVQFDFDGTITIEDVSFMLLDTFTGSAWRDVLREYTEGRIPVGEFNRRVFAHVTEDRETLLDCALNSGKVTVRPGFRELVEYCHKNDYRTAIISNGLRFYIEAIMAELGIDDMEIHAAENAFGPDGIRVRYVGPDGREIQVGLKEAYTELYNREGFRVVYIGNGSSDIHPAKIASKVFATDDLLVKCREDNIDYTPFTDFYDVLEGIKLLPAG